MKKTLLNLAVIAACVLPLGIALPAIAATPNWNVTGAYVVSMEYLGTSYPHDMILAEDDLGNLTGNGGSPAGANVYTWTITSGTVSENTIDFLADYTATADAVTPQTTFHATGTIATDGTLSGVWSDNYQGGTRAGTWTTTSGTALPLGTLAAEDFGVVNYDSGLGFLTGYTAGFGLTNATLASSTAVVVKLYGAGNQLLQTNTAIMPKFNIDITGVQFSSPFDVSGTFNYVTDGYWTNTKETEFGQSVPAVKVIATVTLSNGKIVTAENDMLTGDPATIFPQVLKGHLIIDKVTIPAADPQNFDFTTTGTGYTPFNLTDTATPNDQTLDAGTYTVAETPVVSWTLTSVSCVSNDQTVGVPLQNGEQVTIAAGQTTTCTFTNTKNTPLMPQVHIWKFIDGVQATAANSGNATFPMETTFNSPNLGSVVNAPFTLSPTGWGANDSAYEASFVGSTAGADYEANEVLGGAVVGAACDGTHTFSLVGYTVGDTLTTAMNATPTDTLPSFTNLQSDQNIIVWNKTCPTKGSLVVTKASLGNNGTFKFTGDNGIGSFQITTSGNTGSQTFSNLTPGTYHITEATPAKGWTMTDNECSSVVVTASDVSASCTVTNTSNKLLGEIRGTKYEDRDGDGKLTDGDHHRLSGWTIYIDTNNNSTLDSGELSTVTDNRGIYRFTNLPAGTYTVREVGQTSWVNTYPTSGSYTINLAAGKISKKNNFGNFHQGTISGIKFNDVNGNGRKDINEVGLAGWTIKLLKVGSPTVVATQVTDTNGAYSFTNVSSGTYQVREVAQAGWVQTTQNPSNVKMMSGTNAKNENFGNHFGAVVKNRNPHDNRNDGDDRDNN